MPVNETPATRKDWADLAKVTLKVDLLVAAIVVVALVLH